MCKEILWEHQDLLTVWQLASFIVGIQVSNKGFFILVFLYVLQHDGDGATGRL